MTASTYRFDRDTVVVADGSGTAGRYGATISDNWTIAGTPNGGYVAAIVAAAMGEATGRPWPASMTTHFLRPTTPKADATIDTAIVRVGRQRTLIDAVLSQDGTERIRSRAWMSETVVAQTIEHRHPSLAPPDLPSPSECVDRSEVSQGVDLPILDSLEVRVDPRFVEAGEAGGGPDAEVRGWIRFRDGRSPDIASLGLFCDAFPPPVFSLLGTGIGWVPTLELTTHARREPTSGWIAARMRAGDIWGDHIVEDGELWDSSGNLVARSRQLALLLTS